VGRGVGELGRRLPSMMIGPKVRAAARHVKEDEKEVGRRSSWAMISFYVCD